MDAPESARPSKVMSVPGILKVTTGIGYESKSTTGSSEAASVECPGSAVKAEAECSAGERRLRSLASRADREDGFMVFVNRCKFAESN